MSRSLAGCVLVFALLGFSAPVAAAKSFEIPEATVEARILDDGSVEVTERITLDFDGDFNGSYRDIRLGKAREIENVTVREGERAYRLGLNTALDESGREGDYGVENRGRAVRAVWYHKTSDARRTFTVAYRLLGATVAHDDVVDLDLEAWGDGWESGVGRLRAELSPPTPVSTADPAYRVWGRPDWLELRTERRENATALEALDIPAEQSVRLRVTFPRSVLASTEQASQLAGRGADSIGAEESAEATLGGPVAWLMRLGPWPSMALSAGVGIALGLLATLALWLLFGRQRPPSLAREYEVEPPSDLPPALFPPLMDQTRSVGGASSPRPCSTLCAEAPTTPRRRSRMRARALPSPLTDGNPDPAVLPCPTGRQRREARARRSPT